MQALLLEGLQVVTVQWIGDATQVRAAVLDAGLPWVDLPGTMNSQGTHAVWRGPTERLYVGKPEAPMDHLLRVLPPGCPQLAMALESSEAFAVIQLQSAQLDDWLARLVDASAIPRAEGLVSRCRFSDISVTLMRLSEEFLWIVLDRPLVPYAMDWLAYARERTGDSLARLFLPTTI